MAKNKDVVTIEIAGKDWEKALDKAFKKKVKEVKVDGFRKGSVPKNIYIEKFGIESLYMDAANDVVQDAYTKALQDSKVEPVIEPAIDVKEINEEKVVFEITITGKPEVKLGDYKNLKVKKEDVEVSKEEVDHEIEHLREQFAEIRVKEDGEVEDGDTAVIDFKGTVDGKELEGGSGENFPLEIGSHTFIPGFEEQLIGMKTGEEKEIEVTFPKDYHSDELKGKKATFKVKVNDIKTTVIPEIGEEFFEDLGMEGVNSLETLKEEIKTHILARKEVDSENKFIDDLIEAAIHPTSPVTSSSFLTSFGVLTPTSNTS